MINNAPIQAILYKSYKAATLSLLLCYASSSQAEVVTTSALGHNSSAEYIDTPYMPYANPDAPKGGTLSLDARGTFNAANKWMTTGVAMVGTDYLYDTLMTGSLNEAFTMYPQLATGVTYDTDDASWIIYHPKTWL